MKLKLSLLSAFGLLLSVAQATVHNVVASGSTFSPSTVTITAGDTVEWTNGGGSHNVNGTTTTYPSNPASFGNAVSSSWTYQFQFTTTGTYDYQCDIHVGSGMVGQVIVNPAPTPAVPCAKPFFSEYIEGSSNNKGFEVYNPTGATLDLAPYKVYLSGNGGSFVDKFDLTGMLASGDVFVVVNSQADPAMQAVADASLAFPSVATFNGDDALLLVDTVNNDTLDIIGVPGVDPGSSWPVGTGSTQDFTLVRNMSIDHGQTDWAIGATEWTVNPQNTYSFLGAHSSTCVAAPVVPCSKPFFSEYIEGSSNSKGFEIYNPSGSTLDLAPYKVYLSGNGGSFVDELNLSGMVASGDVYVVANSQADPVMLAAADITLTFPSVATFNGDDALLLVDTVTNDTLDIIGVPGVDPGSSWPVGTGSTQDFTLVRNASVDVGETDWSIGATQWTVNPQNTFSFFGSHSSTCIAGPANPTVNFAKSSQIVDESAGTITVNLLINPTSSVNDTVDVQFVLGSQVVIPGDGSISPLPDLVTGILSLPVLANEDTVSFDISITDDAVLEGNETLFMSVVSVSSGLMIGGNDTYFLVVEDNDAVIPTYTIAQVTGNDANGEPDSLGVEVRLHGVVFTDDFDDNAGFSFDIYDNTGGINIFNFVDVSNYTVTRGDSIMVIGEIDFYNGLTELLVDSIQVLSSGVALKQPAVVTDLGEQTESEYIELDGFTFADTTQWTTGVGNGGFNVDITNGTDTFVMRIDAATDLYSKPIPTTLNVFNVVGTGGQFDGSSPYDEGYQIFPRDSSDIMVIVSSLAEEKLPKVALYPNPARDVVNILTEDNKPKMVSVYGITGLLVKQMSSTSRMIEVPVAELTSGVYFISIEVDGASISRKLIVE